jgi:hypothetical protein
LPFSGVAYQDGRKLGQIEPREIRDYTNRPGCFVWVAMLEANPYGGCVPVQCLKLGEYFRDV